MLRRRRANGLLRSSNGYESLGGARAAISLSTIAGARDTLSGSAKSQPNSSSERSLSFSHTTPHRRSQQSRRHRRFPSCSQRGDPIGAGIVTSLTRPGGNITGLSSRTPDAAGKRLELFHRVVPGLHRLATLADVDNPYAAIDLRQFNEAARALGIEVLNFEIRRSEEIDSVFDALRWRTDALYVLPVPLLFANRARINALALNARLPTLHAVREDVEAGGLMSYGPNWPSMWRRAADLVDKILRGAKPAEIPIEQPIEFDLVINLRTANAVGLTIPNKLLALANAVIE